MDMSRLSPARRAIVSRFAADLSPGGREPHALLADLRNRLDLVLQVVYEQGQLDAARELRAGQIGWTVGPRGD